MTAWASTIPQPPEGHVHSAACDVVATVTWLDGDGAVHVLPIGAACVDTEATIYAHFRKWIGQRFEGATWVGATFTPARGARTEADRG